MFRFVKLAIYGLLGYAVFEFVRGFVEGGSCCAGVGAKQSASRELNRALDEGSPRSNITGAARGERVVTDDAGGASASHVVGRGAVAT